MDSDTGLYNYNARLYDPAIGMFITPDIFVTDFTNPQSLNRYAYCLNNPIMYIDPSGYWGIGFSTPIYSFYIGTEGVSAGIFCMEAGYWWEDGNQVTIGVNASFGYKSGKDEFWGVGVSAGYYYDHQGGSGGLYASAFAGIKYKDLELGYSPTVYTFRGSVYTNNSISAGYSGFGKDVKTSLSYNFNNSDIGLDVGFGDISLSGSYNPKTNDVELDGGFLIKRSFSEDKGHTAEFLGTEFDSHDDINASYQFAALIALSVKLITMGNEDLIDRFSDWRKKVENSAIRHLHSDYLHTPFSEKSEFVFGKGLPFGYNREVVGNDHGFH